MAIKISGDVGEDIISFQANKRASDGLYDKIHFVVEGVDDADSDSVTNNALCAGWQTITPVASLTKSIVDSALTSFRASDVGNGNTVDEEIAAEIATKQAADTEEPVVYGDLS